MSKILITGVNGQLGRSLYDNLKHSYDIVTTSLNSSNIVDYNIDLSQQDNVKHLLTEIKPNVIVNCCAATNVDLCETNREWCRNVNVKIVENLLKNINNKTKFIQISTDFIFDGKKGNYLENSLPSPVNYYGKCKLEAENIIRGTSKNYTILRTSALFSKYLHLNSNRINWILKNLKQKNKINAAVDLISNPTSTDSIAEVIKNMLFIESREIFNYCGQESLSVYDFSCKVSEVFNLDTSLINRVKIVDLNFKAKRPKNTSLITDKIVSMAKCNIYETKYNLDIIKRTPMD